MKKIKPIAKEHRFRKWIQRLFGIKQPSKVFAEQIGKGIDEMHLVPSFTRRVFEPVKISVDVADYHLDGLPLTQAEIKCRIQRALATSLTNEIMEKELYIIQKHEDVINFRTHYRASVTILAPKKEGEA